MNNRAMPHRTSKLRLECRPHRTHPARCVGGDTHSAWDTGDWSGVAQEVATTVGNGTLQASPPSVLQGTEVALQPLADSGSHMPWLSNGLAVHLEVTSMRTNRHCACSPQEPDRQPPITPAHASLVGVASRLGVPLEYLHWCTRSEGRDGGTSPQRTVHSSGRMPKWHHSPSTSACPVCHAPCVTFRLVVAPLRGPGRSPVLPFACCVGSLLSVGRCGRCSCWCHFRVRGAQSWKRLCVEHCWCRRGRGAKGQKQHL